MSGELGRLNKVWCW